MDARTPEELESLLEDAVVLHDARAVAGLFEAGGMLVAERDGVTARGGAEVTRVARQLWRHGYVADCRTMLRVYDLALVAGPRAVTVARRGADGRWRYAFVVIRGGEPEEDRTMHTVVVTMSTDPSRRQEVVRHLRDDVVPWATSRTGFVSGRWLLTIDGHRGAGVLLFDSAEAAHRAAAAPRTYPRDEARAWNIESVEVYEQVVAAEGSVVGGTSISPSRTAG